MSTSKLTFLVLVFLYLPFQLCAQTNDSTLALYKADVMKLYNNEISKNSHLYNGREEVKYNFSLKGHPYFLGREWKKGAIFYDGTLYSDIYLQFNLVTQQIVTMHFDGYQRIQLSKEKVECFTIDGHIFTNVKDVKEKDYNGFYEVLSSGKKSFLAYRGKKINEVYTSSAIEREIEEINAFYVFDGIKFFKISTKKSVLNAFNDLKLEMINYIKDYKIKINKDKQNSLILITNYYNTIKNKQ